MSKFKQRHLLEDGYWVIEFEKGGPKVKHATLVLDSGRSIQGLTMWTEAMIRKEIAKDEGMNAWQWQEVFEDGRPGSEGPDDSNLNAVDGPVGDTGFDAHGFYREVEQLVADYGRSPDEPVLDYIESKLEENLTLEDEIEGIQHRLADQARVEEAISTERLLLTAIDMQDTTLKTVRSLSGIVSGHGITIDQIYHNTDDAEKLSRIAIIVSIFGTLATLGVAAIAFSMFGGK